MRVRVCDSYMHVLCVRQHLMFVYTLDFVSPQKNNNIALAFGPFLESETVSSAHWHTTLLRYVGAAVSSGHFVVASRPFS